MHLKKIILSAVIVIQAGVCIHSEPAGFNQYFINAARKARPSVVNIDIYSKTGTDTTPRYRKIGYGSGTIFTDNGYVITNHHVVKKGNYYRVVNHEGTAFELERFENGSFFLVDPKTDIALLKMDIPSGMRLNPVEFADSGRLSEGEWVMAIGNPYGLNLSITSGIVSSTGRDNIGFVDIEDFIQTDVPINPGNSGGPLINLNGSMVGINTAIRTVSGGYQGISFSIPSNIVKQVCNDLIRYGRVRRGWLGFLVRERKRQTGESARVEIISILKNSPAEKAGLESGDIVRELDGVPVKSLGALVRQINRKQLGRGITVTASRNGKLHDFRIVLHEKQEYQKLRKKIDRFFIEYGIEINENTGPGGVVISAISPQGLSLGLKSGDVPVRLNGASVRSITEFFSIYRRSGGKIENMVVLRDSRMYNIDFLEMD